MLCNKQHSQTYYTRQQLRSVKKEPYVRTSEMAGSVGRVEILIKVHDLTCRAAEEEEMASSSRRQKKAEQLDYYYEH